MKYKIKDFSEANLFVREDKRPNERKVSARWQVSKQGVSDSGAVSTGARIDLIDIGVQVN